MNNAFFKCAIVNKTNYLLNNDNFRYYVNLLPFYNKIERNSFLKKLSILIKISDSSDQLIQQYAELLSKNLNFL